MIKYFPRKAIVTGGAGFIGSHLVGELIENGWDVVILDNLSTGKLENIYPFLKTGTARFVQGSIVDSKLLGEVFSGADYVFHLAAIASVSRSVENPIESHDTNVTGTLNVLIAARDCGVKKVGSSSSVYGDSPNPVERENAVPCPHSPYAVNKLASECYCSVFTSVYKLPTICLRYFNVYGPGQNPDTEYSAVVPKFIKSALHHEPLTILGDGQQARDFVFIDDVVNANLLAAENEATGIFNIGSGKETSVNLLAEKIIRLTGNTGRVVYQEPRIGDIRNSVAEIGKSKKLGYQPEFDLDKGLKVTIDYYRSINSVGAGSPIESLV